MVDNIIKSESLSELTPVPFQFDDIQVLAKKIIQKANAQAQNLLDTARKQAVQLENSSAEDGYNKGYSDGMAKGLAEGQEKGYSEVNTIVNSKVDSLAATLSEILNQLSAERITLQQHAEVDLLKLSLAIAKKIIKHELSVSDVVKDTAREAIALTVSRRDIVLYVNSEDYEALEEYLPSLKAEFNDLERVKIEKDDNIQKGGVRVQTFDGEVDLRIEEQIRALERGLLGRDNVSDEPLEQGGVENSSE